MGSCPMEKIGECNGVTLYFADSRFERPGVYYWDGTDNVRAWPTEEPQPPSAASVGGTHPDALQDGTRSKSTEKRVEALACAPVSERARELLAAEYADDPTLAGKIRAGTSRNGDVPRALRALEQALTQQRGEPLFYVLFEQQDRMVLFDGADETDGLSIWRRREDAQAAADRLHKSHGFPNDYWHVTPLYTTPQPSADAVREVIGSMLNFADVADKCELTEGNAQVAIRAWATQLESLLSGGSNA